MFSTGVEVLGLSPDDEQLKAESDPEFFGAEEPEARASPRSGCDNLYDPSDHPERGDPRLSVGLFVLTLALALVGMWRSPIWSLLALAPALAARSLRSRYAGWGLGIVVGSLLLHFVFRMIGGCLAGGSGYVSMFEDLME